MEFLSHFLKELVDESIKAVVSAGCCKITQNFCLLLQIKKDKKESFFRLEK